MGLFGINLFGSSPKYYLVPVKLNVSHVSQEGRPECGIASVMMVLKYFGVKDLNRQKIKHMAELPYGKGSICYGLGRAIASYGVDAEIISHKTVRSKATKNLERSLDMGGVSLDDFKRDVEQMKEDAISAGVKIEIRDIGLNEVLSRLNRNTIPIVTVNPRRFFKSAEVSVHSLVLTGFDNHRVYYHDPMFYSDCNNVSRIDVFEEAMNDVNGGIIFASRRKAK